MLEAFLLEWFSRAGRDLPWRRTRDPYAILVSEVMLQQTQVERVVPRYLAWLERWPTVEKLAAAPVSDVIRAWQGLGYNRRAVNLHRATQQIAAAGWPDDLTELPGVGRYTADAVAHFAFDSAVLPVDTNVRPCRSGPARVSHLRQPTRSWISARPFAWRAFRAAHPARSLRAVPHRVSAMNRFAVRAASKVPSARDAPARCGSLPSGPERCLLWTVTRLPR